LRKGEKEKRRRGEEEKRSGRVGNPKSEIRNPK
jgi:hypothetical protein